MFQSFQLYESVKYGDFSDAISNSTKDEKNKNVVVEDRSSPLTSSEAFEKKM